MPVLNTADRVYAGSDLVEKVFHGTNLVWASGPFLQLTGRTAVENASVGTNVGTLSVANPGTGTPTYTLTDSAGGRFSITGALLKVAGALDYETAQSHSVTVHVTGMTPNPADRSFLILVTDVDDTPAIITSANTVSNVENTVLAHTLTANESVTWSIVGGADQARFELSGSTLRWVGNGAKDFEAPNDSDTNNAYIVQVRATDLASNITNQTITVTVTDVDEVAPTITSSATVSNAENSVLAHALTANETVTWSIVGGADQSRFELSGSTLRWASNGTKDFETPNDADLNNAYIVQVRATDTAGNPTNQTVTVTVTDVAEGDVTPPTITSSATVSNAENSVLAHTLTANETVTWSIVGGADAARFEISGSTLRWLSNGTKDFEAPNDADSNNAYIVQVRATDLGSNQTNQTITVTVTDVTESGTTVVTAPNGMSWTFPGTVVNGTYVNGDVWVFTNTTLPMPTMSAAPTGSGSTTRNGGMINPTFNTLVENSPNGNDVTTALRNGYDGRCADSSLVYDVAYNAHVSVSTLSPGDSLVSAESISDAEYAIFGSNHRCIGRMACLTVVNYTPFTDEFRPAYFGTTKTRRRFSELNTALLPNMTAPFNPKGITSDDFHMDSSSVYFGAADPTAGTTRNEEMRAGGLYDLQYWIIPISGTNAVSLLKPFKQQYWYPRDSGRVHGAVCCYVMHNFSDRDVFLKNLVQIAIDTYEIAAGHTGRVPFSTGAGFFASPLWLIRMAGLLFNDTPMKNAGSMATGKTDFYGNPYPKWGELGRVNFSATAHAQYRTPPGHTGPKALFGDIPIADVSGGQGPNNTFKDPNGVYDGFPYMQGFSLRYAKAAVNSPDGSVMQLDAASDPSTFPGDDFYNGCPVRAFHGGSVYRTVISDYVGSTRIALFSPTLPVTLSANDDVIIYMSTFPNILDDTYADLQDFPILGTYGIMNNAQMGCFMSSIAMKDEAFWATCVRGDAVAAYNRRWAADRQLWLNWGVYFDYSSAGTGGLNFEFQRDSQGFGGSGNLWMAKLWDTLNIISAGTLPITGQDIVPVLQTHTYSSTIEAGALAIDGQSITPDFAVGGSPVTVFEYVVLGTETGEVGWGGYTIRNTIGAANLGAATGQHARVTIGYRLLSTGTTVNAAIGQRAASGDFYDTTAMAVLTGGDFPSGVYTAPGFVPYVTMISDWILLNEPYDNTKDYTVAAHTVGAAQTFNIADANNTVWYSGIDDAAVADTSGNAFGDHSNKIVIKIEIKG
jgi:hypothetical protein